MILFGTLHLTSSKNMVALWLCNKGSFPNSVEKHKACLPNGREVSTLTRCYCWHSVHREAAAWSNSLQTIHSQNQGFLNPAWEYSYSCSPNLMTAFTTEGEEEVLQQIKIVFWSITNDWSSSTMMATHKQCMWYLNLTAFIDPWCSSASSIPVQISGFLLF